MIALTESRMQELAMTVITAEIRRVFESLHAHEIVLNHWSQVIFEAESMGLAEDQIDASHLAEMVERAVATVTLEFR